MLNILILFAAICGGNCYEPQIVYSKPPIYQIMNPRMSYVDVELICLGFPAIHVVLPPRSRETEELMGSDGSIPKCHRGVWKELK
jgi:hypothetical protein